MDALTKRRQSKQAHLNRLQTYFNGLDHENINFIELKLKLSSLEDCKQQFDQVHDAIIVKSKEADAAAHEEIAENFENQQCALKTNFLTLLQKEPVITTATQQITPSTQGTDIRLPKLDLPTFNGNFNEWISFRDLFSKTINDNSKLSGAQKLQYLKASTRGDAAQLLNSIQITDANFTEAWDILKQRYSNKREIIQSNLKRFFGQEKLTTESSTGIRKLLDVTSECLRSMKILEQPTEHWDTIIVFIIAGKLDPESRREWELSQKTDDIPDWHSMFTFLDQRARALAAAGSNKNKVIINPPTSKFNNQYNNKSTLHHGTTNTCELCSEKHALYQCQKFLDLPITERKECVKKNHLCFNCLNKDHSITNCTSKYNCKTCHKKHNTLLHIDYNNKQNENKSELNEIVGHHSSKTNTSCQVLLLTANVLITDFNGKKHTFRALLDNGSQSSFITEKCSQILNLPCQKVNIPISGLSSASVGSVKKQIKLLLSSPREKEFNLTINAYVLNKITGQQPNCDVTKAEWSHLKGFPLADPTYYKPNNIDILLGADVYPEVILGGKVTGPAGSPTGINTVFGLTLLGTINAKKYNNSSTLHVQSNIENIIQKFWQIEEVPTTKILTKEETECEKHFEQTHQREKDGKYIVRLPFKPNSKELGESRMQALNRFKQTERRYSNQPERRKEYNEVLQEYIAMGHMEIIPADEIQKDMSKVYYLPHHAVIKDSSSTTKLRVVFDASAKTSSGISLNEKLMVGPKLQDDLFSILLRFRKHEVAFTADIEKMYRQFKIHKEDADFQRILWRCNEKEPIKDYRLLTATFGTSSAPHSAVKCIQQLAKDEQQYFPEASRILFDDFYIDDLLSGGKSVNDALDLQQQLLGIMNKGQLKLRKWSSNSSAVLEAIPPEMRETNSLNLDKEHGIKTLGMHWNPSQDIFSYKVNLPSSKEKYTKRDILSEMGKVFDPLGLISPVTINIKILFQNLWKENIGWDQPIPISYQNDYNKYRENLHIIEQYKISRCIIVSSPEIMELHGFSDSSEKAYTAVVYLRSVSLQGNVRVELVAAKTKVAPMKTLSMPKLELCGALLLSKLMDVIQKSLKLNINQMYCYSDSTITLDWISSSPHRWNTFVANRISEIQTTLLDVSWHYVSTKENPADCSSRGISSSELFTHELWWHGPNFLSKTQLQIPTHEKENVKMPEEKKKKITVTHVNIDTSFITRFSSLTKLIRMTAYFKRFLHNALAKKRKVLRISGLLSNKELHSALLHWINTVQSNEFHQDIANLETNKTLHTKSKLIPLAPFIDADGILRVGGRLRNSTVSTDQKNPILLPKYNVLTTLIIDYYHKSLLHAGPQLLHASLQAKYWIIGGKDLINHFIRKCITCYRQKATITTQMMGDLPDYRLQRTRPFLKVGCDYAGPLNLRVMKTRNPKTFKAYICIFVCFVTRAVHLEAVSDLSTEAFIAALKRFTSRRGKATDIHSDNATNFVGANNELKDFLQLVKSTKHNEMIQKYLSTEGTNWHFSPASGPHFGGLWEAGIKSTKYHLTRIVGNSRLNFEELVTLLSQIEACLNSRPLTALSSDPSDMTALTPGHFLIGEALTAIPEPSYMLLKENTLSHWQRIQQKFQHFWSRWSSEYLSRLQQRPKWCARKENIKIGELVLIKDERMPPLQWKLGRILELHPGKDGLTRVATIKTSEGTYKRPIVKLCVLPIDRNQH